jgi:8-oxo-dGTP pyrophosphatase MutT (NUDIX family)
MNIYSTNTYANFSKTIYCLNCNKQGHLYKKCKAPINSYGIVIYKKFIGSHMKYLMIQRKYSHSFTSLMKCKFYNTIDDNLIDFYKLAIIVKYLPKTERYIINNYSFEYMWNKMWTWESAETNSKFHEYLLKYNEVLPYLLILIKMIPAILDQPEWEFPKGKRNLNENDYECAVRECLEETTYTSDEYYTYPNLRLFQDKFIGTDGNIYCNNYYLAALKNYNKLIYYDCINLKQSTEIRKIGWFTLDEIEHKIRNVYPSRYNMIKHINHLIVSWTAC